MVVKTSHEIRNEHTRNQSPYILEPEFNLLLFNASRKYNANAGCMNWLGFESLGYHQLGIQGPGTSM